MKREMPILFSVNCERTFLFSMKRDEDAPFTTIKLEMLNLEAGYHMIARIVEMNRSDRGDHIVTSLYNTYRWRRGGFMVSALASGSGGPGSSPGRGHCVVFLDKTLYSHGASVHSGVQMGTGEFNAGSNPAMD